uniref:GH18 domain-containing protein n=1 Tax=Panagrolaimus sp. ES5 TaxID=591445 RepID=A0AC34FBN1_9BILA
MYIPGTCTHIFFAFAKVNDDFTAAAYDDEDTSNGPNGGYYKRVNALKNQQPGLKTILSFGGWSAGTETFKELKAADTSKLLTAAVTADAETVDEGYNVKEMAKHLDYVNVMTYDFHGDWEDQTGETSPLFSSDNYNTAFAMNYWAQKGMPKEKLLMGIATYGYGWKLNDPNNHGMNAPGKPAPPLPLTQTNGQGAYFEICNIGGTRFWDATQKMPYRVSGDLWYGYDDQSSVRSKMGWLKRNNFGGAFTWALDMDDFNGQCPEGQKYILHNAINEILG